MAMAENQLILNIDKMLDSLATAQSNHSISRVCDRLRSMNEKAFDPKIIAIGTLHRDKPQLQSMEFHKVRYLKSFLEKSTIKTYGYVTTIRRLENEARKCYAETIKLGSDEFVLMLLLDGVFILQFLRKYYSKQVKNQDDADRSDVVFHFQHTVVHLLHDLMLFENQIPLLVIKRLFELSKIDYKEQFVDLIWPLIQITETHHYESRVSSWLQGCNAPHLLGLVHHAKCLPLSDLPSCPDFTGSEMIDMNSATEMHEAGIIFKKATYPNSFLNITFDNRTMSIPPLLITNETESWFRNMMAYENGFRFGRQKYITDYIFFMNILIQSMRDVELLRRCGIITCWAVKDETVYHLITQLENEFDISENFTYANVVLRATHHCKRRRTKWMVRRDKWMASLRQNYFDSPWKFISVVAAVTLLVLTALQTVFAILSYRH